MIERSLVVKDERWYCAFPDVALAPSGQLVCVYNQCTHHHNRAVTQIVQVVSTDRGRTWSAPTPLSEAIDNDPDGWHWNCPRISTLSDGRLACVCDKVQGKGGDAREGGQMTNWLWLSGDEGASWSEPTKLPMFGIVPDRLIELRHGPMAGRWVVTAHSRFADEPGRRSAQRVWWSDDQGKTWSGHSLAGSFEHLWVCEASIFELPDGTLVCVMRENSGTGHDGVKTLSTDGGETWSEPVNFPIPGCHRPVGGVLNNGFVLITHRIRHGGKGWNWMAQNFCASLTDVESCMAKTRKEAHARILPLDYDRARQADTGYSGWVQYDDGEIVVVNYIVDDHRPLAQVRCYRLTVDDFVLDFDQEMNR
ncbi:MAG: sialidase family protein [Planctomycetota bacterium]